MDIKEYNLTVNLKSNPILVENKFIIENLVNYPLVPGVCEIRLQKKGYGKIFIFTNPFDKISKPIKIDKIEGYYIINNIKRKMNVSVSYKDNYTLITYQIWEPIDKKGNITVIINYYTNDIIDKGLLFNVISLPIGSDLTIKNLHVNFISNEHLVYQNFKENNLSVPKNTLLVITAEFSILPLPKLPIHGYILFWSIVILVLIVLITYNEIKRKSKSKGISKDINNENNNR